MQSSSSTVGPINLGNPTEFTIQELAEKVKKSAEKAGLMFALFNNHWQGYAPRNAVDLQKVLQLPFKDLQDDPANRLL